MRLHYVDRTTKENLMNANNNPTLQTKVASDDQNLLNNPSTEAAQRALRSRIWNSYSIPGYGPCDIPAEVYLETLRQVGYSWAAGFLDGEGCVSLAKVHRTCGNRVNYRVRVNIVQNCLETLKTFRDYGGENCVLTQLPHRESYSRPIFQLIYDGAHAYRLLKKLRPFLVRKGDEADVIFEYYAIGQPTRHFGPKGVPSDIWHARGRCYEALRCLKYPCQHLRAPPRTSSDHGGFAARTWLD